MRNFFTQAASQGAIHALSMAALATIAGPLVAQVAAPSPAPVTPGSVIAAAPATDWIAIPANDLLVMTVEPQAGGSSRRVVIQLMAAPFSQGWVDNIRLLARAHWYDGIAVVRVQDNYVVQWGDPDGEDPKKAKPLPLGIKTVPESDYQTSLGQTFAEEADGRAVLKHAAQGAASAPPLGRIVNISRDPYADMTAIISGWPVAISRSGGTAIPAQSKAQSAAQSMSWPVHCYGYVGVGRGMAPDTGNGGELYAVIGHAPRHLDRNIAVVGRVVEGMEHLSSLPRGTGQLGFYETASERLPIRSIRLASDLPDAERPRLQYLSTMSESFAAYMHARANRKDDFFTQPAGGADICNVPVPIRSAP